MNYYFLTDHESKLCFRTSQLATTTTETHFHKLLFKNRKVKFGHFVQPATRLVFHVSVILSVTAQYSICDPFSLQ